MGAQLSKEHDPQQYQALKDAEKAVLEYYQVTDLVKECWLDLPSSNDETLMGVTQLRCLKVGEDGDRPVLFIHGGGGIATDWTPLMKSLVASSANKDSPQQKFQFWFIERPGHGLSDPFDYWPVEDVGVHAAALINAVRLVTGVETIDVVANSMGGWIAHCFASQYPNHVRTLTWVGAPAFYKGAPFPFALRVAASWMGTQLMARPPPPHVPGILMFDTFQQSKESVPDCYLEMYHALFCLRNNSLSWNSLLRAMVSHSDHYEFDLEALGEAFAKKFPCHLIVGGKETFLPADKQTIVESQFGSTAVVAGQGHLPWMEDPDGVAQAIIAKISNS